MKFFSNITIVTLFLGLFLFSCQSKNTVNQDKTSDIDEMLTQYNIAHLFNDQEADSLLITIVTYMGKRAPLADHNSKFSNEFRYYYQEQAQHFTWCYLHKNADDLYHYYIIRPARSSDENQRGAGGSFRIRNDGQLDEFVEIFNTPVNTNDSLKIIGATLFQEMITTGNVDKYLGKPSMIEWPDDRLRYDKERNEWRYDVQP